MYIILDITILKSSLQKFTIVIANWLTATKYLYRNGSFPFCTIFHSSNTDNIFVGPECMSITAGV